MDETKQKYLSDKIRIVSTTKGNQDKFQKDKRYQGTVRTTRIFEDHRRSFK